MKHKFCASATVGILLHIFSVPGQAATLTMRALTPSVTAGQNAYFVLEASGLGAPLGLFQIALGGWESHRAGQPDLLVPFVVDFSGTPGVGPLPILGGHLGDPDFRVWRNPGTGFIPGNPGAGDAVTDVSWSHPSAGFDFVTPTVGLLELSLLSPNSLADRQATQPFDLALVGFHTSAQAANMVFTIRAESDFAPDATASLRVIPEPATIVLLSSGLVAIAFRRLRRRSDA